MAILKVRLLESHFFLTVHCHLVRNSTYYSTSARLLPVAVVLQSVTMNNRLMMTGSFIVNIFPVGAQTAESLHGLSDLKPTITSETFYHSYLHVLHGSAALLVTCRERISMCLHSLPGVAVLLQRLKGVWLVVTVCSIRLDK